MASELLHDLMERSCELTPEEKNRLARFLSEQMANSNGDDEGRAQQSVRFDSRKGNLSIDWLKAHGHEYAGQHIALNGEIRTHLEAQIDTGASCCIFAREVGESLGLEVESGYRQEIQNSDRSLHDVRAHGYCFCLGV